MNPSPPSSGTNGPATVVLNGERTALLLVDDQPQRLMTYEAILADLDVALVKAHSGTDALRQLMEREYAAVLLDVNMPDMDGFEVASMIHQHPRFERTPIIFVTAVHVTDIDRLRGYEVGAVDYVYVPVIPEILRGKVQVLIELYEKRRELQRANEELARANAILHAENTRELQRLNRTLELANADLAAEVTERTRIQEQLQDADRRKDEFLAMLAHELRNPLSAIHNAVQLIQAYRMQEPRLEWAQGVLSRQLKHLTRLMDDLLDVSRITTGKIKLKQERIDLRSIVHRAVETSRSLIESRQHALEVVVPDVPVWVEGDLVRLVQVVDNLLTNAAKYTDQGGAIRLVLETVDAHAHLAVSDTGIGISDALLPKIFELFIQADPSIDRAEGGLGIGLALARALVDLHGGQISATSPGIGAGSRFEVRLPLALDRPVADAMAGRPNFPESGQTVRILLVDDNVDSAEGMAIWLRMRGHEVRVEYAGPSGFEAALSWGPDVVLLDIGLPGMDGYEVARRLRETPKYSALPLIALTGYGRETDRERAAQAGFTHHLVKPIDYDVLARTLAIHTLARASRER